MEILMAEIKFNHDKKDSQVKELLGEDKEAWWRFKILKEATKLKCNQDKKDNEQDRRKIAETFDEVSFEFVTDTFNLLDTKGEITSLKSLKSDQQNLQSNDKKPKQQNLNAGKSPLQKKNPVKSKPSKSKGSSTKLKTSANNDKQQNNDTIIKKEKSTEQNINRKLKKNLNDINNSLEEKIDGLKKNIKKTFENEIKKLDIKEHLMEIKNSLKSKASANDILNLYDQINCLLDSKIQKFNADFDDHITDKHFSIKLDNIERTLETLEGKLVILEDIHNSLSKAEQQFSPRSSESESNFDFEEENSIIKLSKYCQKSLTILTTSARHHFRHQAEVASAKKTTSNHQESKHCEKEIFNQGTIDRETKLIKDLIYKFSDLDALFSSNKENDKIIVSFLKKHGLGKCESLSKGDFVEITEETKKEFERKANFKEEGDYTVVASCFELNDDSAKKAKLELKKE